MTKGARLAAFAVILAATAAQAGELRGRVVAVTDGDTLTILDAGRQHRIRLAGIDAPEKRQPYGQRSKQSLSDLCYGQDAVIEDNGRDRYGRTIGRVWCAGIDANAEQVRRGMAWVIDRYSTDKGLNTIQDEAREARRGLWADSSPIEPWVWRRRHEVEARDPS